MSTLAVAAGVAKREKLSLCVGATGAKQSHRDNLEKFWGSAEHKPAPTAMLSYATQSVNGGGLDQAWSVATGLYHQHVVCWFGALVSAGADWRVQFFGQLPDAAVFITMVSSEYFDSPACLEELVEACSLCFHHGTPRVLVISVSDPTAVLTRVKGDFLGPSDKNKTTAAMVREVAFKKNMLPDPIKGHFFQHFKPNMALLQERIGVLVNKSSQYGKMRKSQSVFPAGAGLASDLGDTYHPVPFRAARGFVDEPPQIVIACSPSLADNGNADDHTWSIANNINDRVTKRFYLPLLSKERDGRQLAATWMQQLKMDSTRCVIIVLSNAFFKDRICCKQLLMACQKFPRQAMDRVVPIFIEPVDMSGDFFGEGDDKHQEANFARPYITMNPVVMKRDGCFQDNFDRNMDALVKRLRLLTDHRTRASLIRKKPSSDSAAYATLQPGSSLATVAETAFPSAMGAGDNYLSIESSVPVSSSQYDVLPELKTAPATSDQYDVLPTRISRALSGESASYSSFGDQVAPDGGTAAAMPPSNGAHGYEAVADAFGQAWNEEDAEFPPLTFPSKPDYETIGFGFGDDEHASDQYATGSGVGAPSLPRVDKAGYLEPQVSQAGVYTLDATDTPYGVFTDDGIEL